MPAARKPDPTKESPPSPPFSPEKAGEPPENGRASADSRLTGTEKSSTMPTDTRREGWTLDNQARLRKSKQRIESLFDLAIAGRLYGKISVTVSFQNGEAHTVGYDINGTEK